MLTISVSGLCLPKYLKAESHRTWSFWQSFRLWSVFVGVSGIITLLAPYVHFCFQIHHSSVKDEVFTHLLSTHTAVRDVTTCLSASLDIRHKILTTTTSCLDSLYHSCRVCLYVIACWLLEAGRPLYNWHSHASHKIYYSCIPFPLSVAKLQFERV